ncbi:metallophosphoesterase [Deinococcus piscis]|uniref:Metallophosphoesterase n=1 Tax=Deinococcus piscis TaxID=394230 RepID=A0ABQ3K6S8_9DEIO|nr:metallophosphoesterase [Deinococcus piscis]GHG04537.1 metallophosphoesterase [Deinococcus piscis]
MPAFAAFVVALCTIWSWSTALAGPQDTLRLALLSDINGPYGTAGYSPEVHRALAQILAWQPDAVLSAGDLIAGQKASLSDAQVRAMWAAFGREVQTPLAQAGLPFGFALGNHDAAQARDRHEAASYWRSQRPLLNGADTAQQPFNHSFTLHSASGKTLFVAAIDAPQADLSDSTLSWLESQLASAAAQAAGARLVLGHLPLAAVSSGKNKVGEVLQPADAQALARIIESTRTLAYVSGHHAAAYPARWNGTGALATGGIGGRDYIGQPGSARSTWMRLWVDLQSGHARAEIVDVSTGQPVPPATLPAHIEGLGGPLVRSLIWP